MSSLHLPEELEKKVNALAKAQGRTRTDIVKESLNEYIKKHSGDLTPFEMGKDLFGQQGSGVDDRSVNRKQYLAKSLEKKHSKNCLFLKRHNFNF